MESGERDAAMSREVPIRESAPPATARAFPRGHESAWSNAGPDHPGADVWAGAISRLQTQVSLNTSMLESHRRQLQEVNMRIDGLKQEMGSVAATLHDFRMELRAKGSAVPARHDPGDLDLLIGQVEAVTAKANEVDGMKLQLDLMKNRMKRFEELGASAVLQAPRPGTSASSSQKELPMHDGPAPPSHNSPYPPPHHGPPHHQPLPPMRTASMAMASPGYGPHHPLQPPIESHGRPSYPPPIEPRHFSGDSSAAHGSPISGFRPSEPLPPPTSLPGWRSSDSLMHLSGLPPAPPPASHSRPTTIEPEPHASGWASINAAQPMKRPHDEPRASPYESPGSPKRPKLAPIMPRSTHTDDSYPPPGIGPSVTTDSSIHARSRAGSDASQPQSQVSSVPASTSAPSYRFITSTTQADPHEGWRREHEGKRHHHGHGHGHGGLPGHGRRGGRRGGRGGRRARGGGVTLLEARPPSSPEWEQSEWAAGQIPPNGYHNHHGVHPYSPVMGRGGTVRRSGGFAGGRSDRDGEPPETPTHGPDEAAAFEAGEGGQTTSSGGKKTRTKPIRNADGVLIRKDGRPDMRSVSSANNLRKVHAKKEAERAEMEGKTPTSTRSIAPMQAYSEDGETTRHSGTPGTPPERDDGEEEYGTQRRHSHEKSDEQSVAERYFPRSNPRENEMKTEEVPEDSHRGAGSESARPSTDVEMSEAQAAEQREKDQDTRMATGEESNKDRGDKGAE